MQEINVTGAQWDVARARVAAYLRYRANPPAEADSGLGRHSIVDALMEGGIVELAAFVETLAGLHVALLAEDLEGDQEAVDADIRRLLDPEMDRLFAKITEVSECQLEDQG